MCGLRVSWALAPGKRQYFALVLGWVEDWVVRSDSRGFVVAGSSWQCGVA